MEIKNHKDLKKENVEIKAQPAEKVTKDDIYIHPKIQRRLAGVVDAIVNEKKYGELANKGILFTGLPGTGKTLTTQYIVNQANANLLVGGIANDPRYIHAVYETARNAAKEKPVVVFWDEVDRFSTRDDIVDPGMRQTLTALLMEMNSIDKNTGVTTIGAANVKKIDIALRRPGRFGKEVEFLPPDAEGRYRILNIHADPKKKKHEFKFNDEDLKKLAGVSYGYTGADLVGLLQEAMENASLDKRKEINYEDFEYALSIQKPSAIRDMPFVEPVFKLEDIGGYEMHKELLFMMLMKSQQGRYLLYGPRGTGKSMMVEALAGELGYNFLVVRGSEPEDKYVGETGKILDRYLSRAKALAPSILFFDEVDALVERKGTLSHKGSWTGLLQSKLSKDIEGVHIFGALNRIDNIRKTFLDRFPHKLYFGPPTAEDQSRIWETHLRDLGVKFHPGDIVASNSKLSGRDIANIVEKVKVYNLPKDSKVFVRLMKGVNYEPECDYEAMRKEYGDAVEDYRQIKEIIKEEDANGSVQAKA